MPERVSTDPSGGSLSVPRAGLLPLGRVFAACFILFVARVAFCAPANLAPEATITATSEYSPAYAAQNVADGRIPEPDSRDDEGQAWAVNGATHLEGAELVFSWDEERTIAEVVYYGRTSFTRNDSWRRCAVYADDGDAPVADQLLAFGHGAQRIPLAEPVRARQLRLVFSGSYGGPNPGASEIQVYSVSPPDALIDTGSEIVPLAALPGNSPALRERLLSGAMGFQEMIAVRRQAVHPSHVYTYHEEGLAPGGGIYRLRFAPEGIETELLVDSSDGVVLDLDLSHDAAEILFSWKRTMTEPFQLFRIKTDGTDLRQVTDHPSNNFNAAWLPDGGIVFLSDRKPAYAYCWVTSTPILYRCDADGENLLRLSANYLNDFTPSVMPDGRILYARWEYVDRPAIPIQSLWAMRPDGTGLEGVFGNRVLSPATFMEAHVVPGGNRILCVMTAHNGPCRGAVGLIDPRLGGNAQEAIRNLTPEVGIGKVDEGDGNQVRGPYESPYPLDDRFFVCSDGGALELRDFDMTGFAVLMEPEGSLGWFQARPVRERPWATTMPLTLPQTPADENPVCAGTHGVTGWADLILQDVYIGLEPAVARGSVAEIAVVQEVEKSQWADVGSRAFGFQFPVVSSGATYAPKRLWGYATVEPDGSAHFQVPAGVPLYFMAVDHEGRAHQRMRTFTHLMPGERQSCVGCHADRNSAAPPLSRVRPLAAERPAQSLREPDWGVAGFSYPHIVQPVLDRHCVTCHNALDPPAGLDLTGDYTDFFSVSYDALVRRGTGAEDWTIGGFSPAQMGRSPYTSWIPTYNGMESNILEIRPGAWGALASRLAEVVISGHPDDQGEPRVRLTPAERRRVFTWLDLNVPYYGTPESRHPELPGLRRLYPETLDETLAQVAERRCVACHEGGRIPRQFSTRITNPELNSFLLAPLSREAGGLERCGQPVFATREDPDYRAILDAFEPVHARIAASPREDMIAAPATPPGEGRPLLSSRSLP